MVTTELTRKRVTTLERPFRKTLISQGFWGIIKMKTFVVLSISSLLFPGYFLRADVAKNTRSGIEVVITGLTRNQFGSNPTRVRIPPAAPTCVDKKDAGEKSALRCGFFSSFALAIAFSENKITAFTKMGSVISKLRWRRCKMGQNRPF